MSVMIPYPFSQRWRHPQRTNERVGGVLYIQVNHAHLAESSDFSIMPFVFSPLFSVFNDLHCIVVKLILSAVECLGVLSCFINAKQMYGSCEEVRDSRCVFFIHQITVKQLVPGFERFPLRQVLVFISFAVKTISAYPQVRKCLPWLCCEGHLLIPSARRVNQN